MNDTAIMSTVRVKKDNNKNTRKQDRSILDMEVTIQNVMKDLRNRINDTYDTYLIENKKVIKLPSYSDLSKNIELRYNISVQLTDAMDELNELRLRVSIVSRYIEDIRNIQATNKNEYVLMANFRTNLKKYSDELTSYKFELSDLAKNVNNKLRIIDNMNWNNDL